MKVMKTLVSEHFSGREKEIVDILELECPEWRKRDLIAERLGVSPNEQWLVYLVPDCDGQEVFNLMLHLYELLHDRKRP